MWKTVECVECVMFTEKILDGKLFLFCAAHCSFSAWNNESYTSVLFLKIEKYIVLPFFNREREIERDRERQQLFYSFLFNLFMALSYRTQSNNLQIKSMDWFLYDWNHPATPASSPWLNNSNDYYYKTI